MVLKRIAVGVLLFALAVVLMVTPGASPSIPTAPQFLLALGLVIVAVGVRYLKPSGESSAVSPPVPEPPADLPEPGKDIESQLQTVSRTPLRPDAKKHWKETRADLQSRLHSLTVDTLTERYSLSETEANRLIDAGNWSESPHAVAFFTGSYPDWTPSRVSLRQKHLSSRADVGKQAAHVIDELGAIERGDRMLSESALMDGDPAGRSDRRESESPSNAANGSTDETGETA